MTRSPVEERGDPSDRPERAAFVKASQPVLDRHRKELDTKLLDYLK